MRTSRFEIHYAAPDFHALRQLELHIREAVRPVESFSLGLLCII